MHPLRILLLISFAIAIAVAVAFGFTLHRASASGGIPPLPDGVIAIIAVGVAVAFIVPATSIFAWAVRRARDIDVITEHSRRIAEGHYDEAVTAKPYAEELDELARAIEELRSIVVRQKTSFEEQRAAMEQIVASLGEGLIALSPKGRIVFANERIADLFEVKGVVGRPLLEVVRKQSLVSAFDRALRGEASTDRVTVHSGAVERQLELRVFPVAASTEIAAVALFIDITQIERLQRIRKDFLDDFSHEVRTPLAGLRSAAETFESGALSAEQELQLRRIIRRQLGRIERLVQDLSELNRIESGELVLERRAVDLRHLLDELSDDFRERLSGKPVTIAVRGESSLAQVDPLRVQQIFSNLLDNAAKHGGARGEIVVDIGGGEGEAIVTIADEGEGIPPQEIDRIFHRFYRVDKSRSQEVPGVGLGLAIAKHLVRLHGGSIRAYNRPTGGAAFEVRLPAA